MSKWKLYAVLLAVYAIAGCDERSTAKHAGSASTQKSATSTQGSSASTQGSSASTQASATSNQGDKFFSYPQVAALTAALERNDWADAEKALHAGANVNAIGKDGIYPLIWAMYIKNKPAFEWLLEHGADPNFDSGGSDGCALFWAAEANDSDWLRMLLAHKANPNLLHKNAVWTETPLLAAGGLCRLENLKMLIAAGADINYQQSKQDGGATPAIHAADSGFLEGVYELLEAGANIRPRDTGGWDLTDYVARRPPDPWREKVLQLLRERGADVDGALKAASDAEAKYRKDNPWRYR
jgi:ankyrin repeat protein